MAGQTGFQLLPLVVRTLVKSHQIFDLIFCSTFPLVWYGNHRNRGYISPDTLEKIGTLPFVEDRWKQLAKELGAWREQSFEVPKKK